MPIVLGTNVLVSGALFPQSTTGKVFEKAVLQDSLLFSESTLAELRAVLGRPKFQRYLDPARRDRFIARCVEASSVVEIRQMINACRDPSDDKFLEVATNGNARCIVTGDVDLRVLHPFEGIAIISPSDYLDQPGPAGR